MGLKICDECDGRCCSLRVELTTYDIGQISSEVGEEPFMELIPAKENRIGFRLKNGYWRFVMKQKNDYCIFFNKDSRYHCGIYEHRPAICRSFPFTMKRNRIVRIGNSKCPNVKGHEWKNDETCPDKIAECADEHYKYRKIIANWNKTATGDEDVENFLEYAFERMGNTEKKKNPFQELKDRICGLFQ